MRPGILPGLACVMFAGVVHGADAPAQPVAADPATEDLVRRVAALEAQNVNREANPIHFMGFAALEWRAHSDEPGDDQGNGFSLGMFDLFVRRDLGERGVFLGEVVLEANEKGETNVDLERCVLSYRPVDSLELDAGRYHSHFGWWNVNYHHGEWLQPSIGRPAGLEFEDGGGVLPAHGIGVAAEQNVALSFARMVLVAEVGNGRGPVPDPPQMAGDSNNPKALNIAASLTPAAWSDLELGANVYIDRISSSTGDPDFPDQNDLDEQIIGAYAAILHGPLQANIEGFAIRHHDRSTGDTARSATGYALLAWRFSELSTGDLTPYVRGDYLKVSDGDTYFASVDDRTDLNLGLRWDMTSTLAIKAQGTRSLYTLAGGEHDRSSAFTVQVSGTF